MKFDSLPTPCLVLDRTKLSQNIQTMNARIDHYGVILRPHVKTAKSLDVSRLINNGEAGPITVSTLQEAEYFSEGGYTDILYAVSIIPAKLPRVKALMDKGCDLKLLLDDANIAQQVSDQAESMNTRFRVLIEIDCDGHRAGLKPDDPAVLNLARLLNELPGTEFMGLMTHAGGSYFCETTDQIKQHAIRETQAIVDAAQTITDAGIPVPIRSVGSTPTATFAEDLTGITEVRAGVYVFQDLYQVGLGVCELEDIALSVLTTIISHKPDHNRLLVDAGGLALSKDRGTASQKRDCGYGLVCDAGGHVIDELIVDGANQEHGMITTTSGSLDFYRFPIGSQLRILPNHACMTAAAHDRYFVVDGSDEVTATWQRCNGW